MESIAFPDATAEAKIWNSNIYEIERIRTGDGQFLLRHDSIVFYKSEGNYNHLINGFKNRYVFITPYQGSHWATTDNIPRDSAFVYDYVSANLYHYNASKYSLSSVEPSIPIYSTETILMRKSKGDGGPAFIDNVDTDKRKIYLKALDLKTIDSIDLDLVAKPAGEYN